MRCTCFTLMKQQCSNCHPDDLRELIYNNIIDPLKVLLTIVAVKDEPASSRTVDWSALNSRALKTPPLSQPNSP